MAKYDFRSILQQKENRLEAMVELQRRIFDDLGVRGEVGFYGTADRGQAYVLLQALGETLDGVHVRGEYEEGLFDVARATKDAEEIELMQEVAQLTSEVISATVEFLRAHRVEGETLVTENGSPLTIGAAKQHILRLLAERRLEDPEGVIFAIGPDAGVPHSKGQADDPIRLGETIVYDLFPRRAGGYFFDCTRTFCLGYAPPEIEKVHRDVGDCIDAVIDAAEVGIEAKQLQRVACDFFEGRGYPTIASNPQTEEGFVHPISHGLGLSIHEEPHFTDVPSNTQTLRPGHVFTIEPGLYYPKRGYGVRIEDVVWIDEEGRVHNLTKLSRELVIKME
jgi:Xaa-Pro aminopeptidase